MASSASTSKVCFVRPPVFSSPLPSCRYSPKLIRSAYFTRFAELTKNPFNFESSPSVSRGWDRKRKSLTRNHKTESPRNSSCSLSPAWRARSLAWELCVNAQLEFLGDSVLGFLVSDFLFRSH